MKVKVFVRNVQKGPQQVRQTDVGQPAQKVRPQTRLRHLVQQRQARRATWTPYLFLAPAILYTVLVLLIPMIEGVLNSLYGGQQLTPFRGAFVGLANYGRLIHDPSFWLSLQVTLVYTVACVILTLTVALAVALLINSDFHGRTLARALVTLPWATPTVAAMLIWSWMFNYEYGVLNVGLRTFGISRLGVAWLFDPHVALISVLLVTIWKIFPFSTVVLLTALQSVDHELYEAADLDGASKTGKFRYVTLPGISPTIALLILLIIIWSFQRFAIIWLLTQGGPIGATQTIVIMLYNNAFRFMDIGYGAAIGAVGLVMSLIVASIYFIAERYTALGEAR